MYNFIDTHIIIKNVYSDIDIQSKKLNSFVIKECDDSDNIEVLKTKLKSDFISTSIYKSIIDYNYIRSYRIIINEVDIIQLNIISKNKSIKKSELNDIIAVIRFFRELDIEFPKITLKINIWMSDLKKMLPSHNNKRILTCENVNTGFTIYKKSDIVKSVYDIKEIYIYRKEELHKVLIHEMIHAYDLDTYFIRNHQKYSDRLEDIYNIHSKYGIKIYESYVETIAILLHCIYLSRRDKNSLNKAILLEIKYSLFQTAKILEYYNIHSIKELKNNIYEESSIFSYYIIKSALLFNLKAFLKMCYTYNNNYIQIKQNWIKEFKKLIQKSLDKKNFMNTIDKTLTFIIDNNKNIKNNNNIKNIKNKKYILKNLKMSLL
jgi:hypothetical protein